MNVNPFSYLIEKLKSKVSKSGDRMTGELEFYNLGDSIHINRAGNATYSGWIKFSNANGLCGMYGAHNNKKPYFYDGNDFTQIALKSDIEINGQAVTYSSYISDAGYIKTWRIGKMYFISFNAPISPCSADTVLISGYPNTIQRFYGLLGADDGTNIRIELKNGELLTNTAVTVWKWYAGNIFFYES